MLIVTYNCYIFDYLMILLNYKGDWFGIYAYS